MDSPTYKPRDDQPSEVSVPATSARQGVISGRVLTVLVTSLASGIIALLIAWLIFH
jgi:hypothetical protein